MQFYYIDTIEQVKAKEDNPLTVNEYGAREICKIKDKDGNSVPMPLPQVESKYFKKLSDVSADLVTVDETKNHYYMDIKIVNSDGGIERKDKVGTKQEVELKSSTPEPETEG